MACDKVYSLTSELILGDVGNSAQPTSHEIAFFVDYLKCLLYNINTPSLNR